MIKKLIQEIIEKEIKSMILSDIDDTQNTIVTNTHSFIGQYVIVRGHNAGVRAGALVQDTLGSIVLEDARMLRRRRCKQGTGLSGIAMHGLADKTEVVINETIAKITITDMQVSTFLPCTAEVEKQIREYKAG